MIVDIDKILQECGVEIDKEKASIIAQWCYEHRRDIPLKAEEGLYMDRIKEAIDATLQDIYQITFDEITARSKSQYISDKRAMCMYLVRSETELPLVEIGRIFKRNHSSVIHAVNSFEFSRDNHESVRQDYNYFKQKVEEKL